MFSLSDSPLLKIIKLSPRFPRNDRVVCGGVCLHKYFAQAANDKTHLWNNQKPFYCFVIYSSYSGFRCKTSTTSWPFLWKMCWNQNSETVDLWVYTLTIKHKYTCWLNCWCVTMFPNIELYFVSLFLFMMLLSWLASCLTWSHPIKDDVLATLCV